MPCPLPRLHVRTAMSYSKLSLQALEMFEVLSRTLSLQKTAQTMGLSISSVSHHLNRLEDELGVRLIDRAHRPMVLTPAGQNFSDRIQEGLRHIRLAQSETAIGGLYQARQLRIGVIEDFEGNIVPDLVIKLAQNLPRLKLTLRTHPSHEAITLVENRSLNLAIAARNQGKDQRYVAHDLLRDPFVMVTPKSLAAENDAYLGDTAGVPFLRYNPQHQIGMQIEAHLKRNGISLANRHEFDSNQSIMGLIAHAQGWTITTPVVLMRTQRFLNDVQVTPLPLAAFARTISLFAEPEHNAETGRVIATVLRRLLQAHILDPCLQLYPWLDGSLRAIDQGEDRA